jgi:hypothetical protein
MSYIAALLADSNSFWDISLGNVLTIVVGIISLAVAFQKLRGDIQVNNVELNDLSKRVSNGEEEMKQLSKMGVLTSISQHERRLMNLELMMTDIATLKTDIVWIKENMRMRHTPPV